MDLLILWGLNLFISSNNRLNFLHRSIINLLSYRLSLLNNRSVILLRIQIPLFLLILLVSSTCILVIRVSMNIVLIVVLELELICIKILLLNIRVIVRRLNLRNAIFYNDCILNRDGAMYLSYLVLLLEYIIVPIVEEVIFIWCLLINLLLLLLLKGVRVFQKLLNFVIWGQLIVDLYKVRSFWFVPGYHLSYLIT